MKTVSTILMILYLLFAVGTFSKKEDKKDHFKLGPIQMFIIGGYFVYCLIGELFEFEKLITYSFISFTYCLGDLIFDFKKINQVLISRYFHYKLGLSLLSMAIYFIWFH